MPMPNESPYKIAVPTKTAVQISRTKLHRILSGSCESAVHTPK